jgi:hypothetical protein
MPGPVSDEPEGAQPIRRFAECFAEVYIGVEE